MGEPDLGALDLTIAGLAAKVGGHLEQVRHPGGSEGMTLRNEPTGNVDGDAPVPPRTSRVNEVTCPARLA